MGPIVSQLAVNPDAVTAANQGNMAGFVKALEKDAEGNGGGNSSKEKNKKPEDGKEKKPDEDDDEGMQLD